MRQFENVTITLPKNMLEKVDEKAKELAEAGETAVPNRSLIIRKALRSFLEMEVTKHVSEDPSKR